MRQLVSLIVLLFLLPAASVLAEDLPQVLQPNTKAYSASEVAALTQAMTTLTETLNYYDMASRRYFSASDWSSRDFAAYTAGVLSGKGYDTLLVSGAGWSDGTHTWVLVGTPLGAKTVWIPVEAAPEKGQAQQTLGHIPNTADAAGEMWFDPSYLAFVTLVRLPPNALPVARIRPRAFGPIQINRNVELMALGSYDPDGEIVLYQWNFGDGETLTTVSWSILHKFTGKNKYTVILSVVDSRGSKATSSTALEVLEPMDPNAGDQSRNERCGCGS